MFAVMFLLCLLAVCWVLFIKFFNAQYLSEEITRQLQLALNRPVIINSLDLRFFNTLELKGFSVLDTEVAHGEALLSAESVFVHFKLLPLLDRQLIIDEVTLNRPRVNIVRGADGRYNVPEVNISSSQSHVYRSSSGENLTVSAEDWTVKDGVFSYKDLQNQTSHAIYGVNLHFERLRFNELSRFRAEFVLRNKWRDNISDIDIKGTGHVNFANFHWKDFALRSLRAQVFVFRKPVSLTVDLDNLYTPYFNIRAQIPAFEGKDLSLFKDDWGEFYLPQSSMRLKGSLSNGYRLLKLSEALILADDANITASAEADFTQSPWTADIAFTTEPLDLAAWSKNYPRLSPYKLTGKTSLDVHLLRQEGKWALPKLDLALQDVSGEFYYFPVQGVNGDFSAAQNFTDLYARLTSGKVTVDRSVFDKLDFSATYRQGNLYANIASGELNGVPLKMNLSVNKLTSSNRRIRTNIYLKHFDPMAFIEVVRDFVTVIGRTKTVKAKPRVSGQLAWLENFRDRLPKFMPNFAGTLSADTFSSEVISGNSFYAEFDFKGLLPGMKRLDGTLDARMQDGVIHQMEKLAEEQKALNITFTPFILMHRMERAGSFKVGQVLRDVPYEELAVSADFAGGHMTINNAYTQGPTISALVQGWVNWVEENFDIIIWTMFNNTSRSGALAENLTDESGNPALAFQVSSQRGLRTDFKTNRDFIKGDFHAKK